MNAATVANAVNKTMLIAPMIAVTTNTRAGVIRSVCPAAAASGAEVSVENVSLIFDQTSIDPSVRYRIPIAIIQTKNITIATIRLIFSTVHGSTRLSCSDASRGGRRGALGRRALAAPAAATRRAAARPPASQRRRPPRHQYCREPMTWSTARARTAPSRGRSTVSGGAIGDRPGRGRTRRTAVDGVGVGVPRDRHQAVAL